DPAIGSAAAALRCEIHQGIEMGRPSVIYTAANGDIEPGWVTGGGQAIVVGKGTLTYREALKAKRVSKISRTLALIAM
ncbi:hypothetical protein Q5762_39700, partial [Streptomyces sp. P9(2023)]